MHNINSAKFYQMIFMSFKILLKISSSVVKHVVVGARGLGFDYRASQIERSVVNGSPTLRHFLVAVLP